MNVVLRGETARETDVRGAFFMSDRHTPLPPKAVELVRLALAIREVLEDEGNAESEEGQVALACAILNRFRRYGPDEGGSGGAAGDRSCEFGKASFARAFAVACLVLSGDIDDPTGGATHFHRHTLNPKWARRATPKALIGQHMFYVRAI
tara:strand:+ start:9434 stop:9883 length:450 start_codon:yes stop_codon:yes gene_type:complete